MRRVGRIPLARPRVGRPEARAVLRVLQSRHLAQGPEVLALERAASAALGDRPVVAVSSGGSALLLAMAACGVGPGCEVVVPVFTFPAAAQAALWLGADPVPADVDPESLGVTAATVAARLTPRTRAVVVAHAFGIPADVEGVADLARPRGIAVIEDAACAFGGRTAGGRPAGTAGEFGCFSLHPRKVVTGGEGGLVACDPGFEARVRELRDYGRTGRGFGDVFGATGLNFRLADLCAAVARVQVGRVAGSVRRRERLVQRYRTRLDGCPGVRVPGGYARAGQTWQSFVVRVPGARDVAHALGRRGIEAGPAAHALTDQTFFRSRWDARRFRCPDGEALAREALALPLFDEMTTREVDRVCDALIAVVAGVSVPRSGAGLAGALRSRSRR